MLEEKTVAQRVLYLLEYEFFSLLNAKTGWGRKEVKQREEIKQLYRDAMKNAQIKALTEQLTK